VTFDPRLASRRRWEHNGNIKVAVLIQDNERRTESRTFQCTLQVECSRGCRRILNRTRDVTHQALDCRGRGCRVVAVGDRHHGEKCESKEERAKPRFRDFRDSHLKSFPHQNTFPCAGAVVLNEFDRICDPYAIAAGYDLKVQKHNQMRSRLRNALKCRS
jgi:hypothetical protein